MAPKKGESKERSKTIEDVADVLEVNDLGLHRAAERLI